MHVEDSILYTNLGSDKCQTEHLRESGNADYLKASKIIELAHGRGVSELTNRSVKDFMCKEQLPFKLFGMNAAYYFVQVISHFLFESYKTDVACDVVSKSSYPTTVRREHTGTGSEQAKCAQEWGSFKNMNYQDAEFCFFCWSDTQTSRQYQVSLKIKATSPLFFGHFKIAQFRNNLMVVNEYQRYCFAFD